MLAIDFSRDEILLGNQRWLTGYIPIGGPAAALLHRDRHIELISDRIGKPVTEHYGTQGFPLELVNGFSPALLAQRIARLEPARLGIAETECFPSAVAAILEEQPDGATADRGRLRCVPTPAHAQESAYELARIRRAAAISPTRSGSACPTFSK